MTTDRRRPGSAERWGPLWGARPADWALSEDQQVPTYEEALRARRARAGPAACSTSAAASGRSCASSPSAAARAFGLDASEALLDVARTRLPDADLRVGDMEALPYDDDTFDLVTGFNSFFFANDIVAALREAGRVAKPGAPVVIQVWGPHERNDLEAMKEIVRPYFPPRARRTRRPSPTTPSPACSRTSRRRAGLDARERRSTPPGPTSSPTQETAPPRAGRSRRDRRPRRSRPRGGGQGRDRRRARAVPRRRRQLPAPEHVPLPDRARTMSYYAVIREAGPGWTDGGIAGAAGRRRPRRVHERRSPTRASSSSPGRSPEARHGRLRALLIVDADSEDEIRRPPRRRPLGRARTGS